MVAVLYALGHGFRHRPEDEADRYAAEVGQCGDIARACELLADAVELQRNPQEGRSLRKRETVAARPPQEGQTHRMPAASLWWTSSVLQFGQLYVVMIPG